jgi:hypothetical protein
VLIPFDDCMIQVVSDIPSETTNTYDSHLLIFVYLGILIILSPHTGLRIWFNVFQCFVAQTQ